MPARECRNGKIIRAFSARCVAEKSPGIACVSGKTGDCPHSFCRQTSRPECFSKAFAPRRQCPPNPFAPPSAAHQIYHMPVQDDVIEIEGRITSVLAGTMFRVELANKHIVLAHISGRMRKSFIRLTTGDRVKLEMSPYDLSKARIVYRLQG
jgi:translation initiation factor IF-1